MDLYRRCGCPENYLKYTFSIYKAKYDNRNGESLGKMMLSNLHNHPWAVLLQRTVLIDDAIAIGASYRRKREFPNSVRLHPDRIRDNDSRSH